MVWTVIKGIFTLQNGICQPFVSFLFLTVGTIAAERKARKGVTTDGNSYYPILDLGTVRGLTVFLVELGLILALATRGGEPVFVFSILSIRKGKLSLRKDDVDRLCRAGDIEALDIKDMEICLWGLVSEKFCSS